MLRHIFPISRSHPTVATYLAHLVESPFGSERYHCNLVGTPLGVATYLTHHKESPLGAVIYHGNLVTSPLAPWHYYSHLVEAPVGTMA